MQTSPIRVEVFLQVVIEKPFKAYRVMDALPSKWEFFKCKLYPVPAVKKPEVTTASLGSGQIANSTTPSRTTLQTSIVTSALGSSIPAPLVVGLFSSNCEVVPIQ